MRVRQREAAEFGIVKVNHLIASNTDEMVVMIGVTVESGRGCEVPGSLGYSQFDQGFQHPIDGRPRHSGQTGFHVFENLVDRGMIMTLDECTQNDAALHGHRNASLATQRFEQLQLVIFSQWLFTQSFIQCSLFCPCGAGRDPPLRH
jgi:hypothetical protein